MYDKPIYFKDGHFYCEECAKDDESAILMDETNELILSQGGIKTKCVHCHACKEMLDRRTTTERTADNIFFSTAMLVGRIISAYESGMHPDALLKELITIVEDEDGHAIPLLVIPVMTPDGSKEFVAARILLKDDVARINKTVSDRATAEDIDWMRETYEASKRDQEPPPPPQNK